MVVSLTLKTREGPLRKFVRQTYRSCGGLAIVREECGSALAGGEGVPAN
jgi:hypothetical protein